MKRNTTFLTDDQRLQLIDLLHVEACSCVIRNGDVTRIFRERGVKDLYRLLEEEPELLAGAFVADKVVGKGAAALMILGGGGELHADVISRPARRLLAAHEQIADLLEAKAVVGNKALHQLFNGDPAEQQLSGCGNFPAVYDLGSGHLAARGQTGTYPFTVQLANATLDFVLFIKFLFDLVVGFCICGQLVYQLHVVFILCDHLLDLCRMQQFFFFHLISPLLSEQRFRLFGLHIVQILLLESSA